MVRIHDRVACAPDTPENQFCMDNNAGLENQQFIHVSITNTGRTIIQSANVSVRLHQLRFADHDSTRCPNSVTNMAGTRGKRLSSAAPFPSSGTCPWVSVRLREGREYVRAKFRLRIR